MKRLFLLGALSFALAAPGARAQGSSSSPAAPASSSATQQTQEQNSSATSATPAAPKKVWTNEDIGSLRADSTISTFQPKGKNAGNRNAAARGNSQGRDAAWYHQQIAALQEKIPPIDAKIAELQKGVNGETVNDPTSSSRPYSGVHAGSWQSQINDLQTKRANIVSRISSLEDQARHAGVTTNQVP
ncbi:MAG TPA: hypothetical protein VMJ93_00330 [Verrucomicrobiae bacterium]|nr:hypothetical protein [Verrucomicrobiae bacterium]